MKFNPNIHKRRSIRLKGYDYSQAGYYFVTICVQNKHCIFGEIIDNTMKLNETGRIVQMVWNELPQHYNNIELGEFVIMPNHIHGIIVINDTNIVNVGAGLKPAPTVKSAPTLMTATITVSTTTKQHGLPEIVRALKTFSARKINELHNTQSEKLWQRNYWEQIIRNEQMHKRIADYIINNPANWNKDDFHPNFLSSFMNYATSAKNFLLYI